MSVTVKLVDKSSGKAVITQFETEPGPATGKQVRMLMHVKPKMLYSVDIAGHTQREAGPIGDEEVVYLREGREFEVIK